MNYDVIIVNDGSKDDSLIIKAYELVKIDLDVNNQIPTKPLREEYLNQPILLLKIDCR
jgi:glycosyltransferase involved in cell wall biosynthesis